MSNEEGEAVCIQRFLNWYNKQYKKIDYTYERAESRFPELEGKSNWDFVAYERGNPEKWIGIELKEVSTFREVDKWFEFWKGLCSDLTKSLAVKGIQGKFHIIRTPVMNLRPRERAKLLKALVEVIAGKESTLKPDEFTDIGPDIGDKFASWPRDKIRNHDEYRRWGESRPCELLIKKCPDSACEVTFVHPIRAFDSREQHKETYNEANIKHANEQLKLAKEKGARKTILLFACRPFIYPDLIKNEVQDLDRNLIPDINYIYLVGMGNSEDRVVKIYSNQ